MLRRTWRCRCAEAMLVSILVKACKGAIHFSARLNGQMQKYGNIFHLMLRLAGKGNRMPHSFEYATEYSFLRIKICFYLF